MRIREAVEGPGSCLEGWDGWGSDPPSESNTRAQSLARGCRATAGRRVLTATTLCCRSVWGEAQGHPAGSLPALLLVEAPRSVLSMLQGLRCELESQFTTHMCAGALDVTDRRRPLTLLCCPHGARAPYFLPWVLVLERLHRHEVPWAPGEQPVT